MGTKLTGQVAIITGSGRGIGREIAKLFAQEGAKVVVCSRTHSEINDTAKQIRAAGGRVLAVGADITAQAQVEALVSATLQEFSRIDILVNNAGVNIPGRLIDIKIAEWDTILDSYLKGTYLCCREIIPVMARQKKGKIINICSTAGIRGVPGAVPYSASKFGLRGFSQALALEVKDFGIRVSVIYPGRVSNPNWDKIPGVDRSKMLEAIDIAQAVLFIASQADRAVISELVIRPFPEDPA